MRRFRDIVHLVHLEGIARAPQGPPWASVCLFGAPTVAVMLSLSRLPAPLVRYKHCRYWPRGRCSDATACARLPFGTSQGHDGAFRK